MKALDFYIDRVKTLPPAPRLLVELLRLLQEPEVDASSIVDCVTFDPALTASVLQRCNSAAQGLAEPVHSISEGVVRLGFNEIYRLVAATIAETALNSPQPGYGIAAGQLWQHSAATAVAARVVAGRLGLEVNQAFTAALLHDIGKLVLSSLLEDAYNEVIRETEQAGHSFLKTEKILLGVDHAEAGGRLLERWGFPDVLVSAVRCHHDPVQANPHKRLAACVYVSDMVAHLLGLGLGYQAYAVEGRPEALRILEIAPRELESLVIEANTALERTEWATQIAP